MNRYINFVLLLCLVVIASEAKPARGRCRKSSPTKCVPRQRRPAFPEPEERLRVKWSPDGLVGNRYFEQDGRHYVEIQELSPIGNGRYRIRSRTEETTAPPGGLPYPPPEFPQEPIGAGSSNIERSQSWMEELAAVPAWPVTRPDQNVQDVRSREMVQPEAASQQSPPEEPTREDVEGQQARVIEPAHPRTEAAKNEERIAAEIHQQPRAMTKDEAYARVAPIATPREEPETHYEGYHYYYDDTWYEPANQQHYPRLLFSPRFGWREMTEDEVLRIPNIRPISEFDPALTVSNGPFPANHNHRQQVHTEKERYPVQSGGYEQPVQQSSTQAQLSAYRYAPGAHPRPHSEGSKEVAPQDRVQHQRGTWIFQGGNWQFEPNGSVDLGPEATPETASPVYNDGTWVFSDGAWHYKTPSPTEKQDQPVVENPPEKMVGNPELENNDSVVPPKKVMVKVRKFHAPGNLVKENQENLREFKAKAVQIDHNGPSQKDRIEGSPKKMVETEREAASAIAPGQLPQIADDSVQYLQKGNLAAVVYSEKDRNENQEEIKKEEERKTEEGDENKTQQGGAHFIKKGRIGAYIYSGSDGGTENLSKDSDKSSQDDNNESLLSPDEFKRLIPSEHAVSRLQLKDHSGIKPCHTESVDSAGGDFWLLRTRPCDENSREGRIILPNGEVLKFYGQPQLVYV